MEFKQVIRELVFGKYEPKFLPLYMKNAQFDSPLSKKDKEYLLPTTFKIVTSGQEVFLYDRTHIPPSNPVQRFTK